MAENSNSDSSEDDFLPLYQIKCEPNMICHFSGCNAPAVDYFLCPYRHFVDYHHVPTVEGLVVRLKLEGIEGLLHTSEDSITYVQNIIASHNRFFAICINLTPDYLRVWCLSLSPREKGEDSETFWVGFQYESRDRTEQLIHVRRVFDEKSRDAQSTIDILYSVSVEDAKKLLIQRKSDGRLKILLNVHIHKFEYEEEDSRK